MPNKPLLKVGALRHVLALWTLFVFSTNALSQAPALEVTTTLASSYSQGAEDAVTITVKLDEVAGFEQGVLFLNIVERDPAQNYPQAAHKLFASANEEPGIFREVVSRQALRDGLQTTLSFSLRDRAEPGDYSLVVQLFEGETTNPGRVRVENRVGLRVFDFAVEAAED